MINWRTFSPYLALLLALGLSSFYVGKSFLHRLYSPTSHQHQVSGLSLNTTNFQYNDHGSLEYQFHIHKTLQLKDGRTYLKKLSATLYGSDPQNPWIGSADRGELSADHEQLLLIGHVQAMQTPTNPSLPVYRFNTSQLTLHPNQHTADTDQPVTFQQLHSKTITTGVGLHIDEAQQILTILSQVNSTYETKT